LQDAIAAVVFAECRPLSINALRFILRA